MKSNTRSNVYKLTYLAVMTALVIVLQMAGQFIHLGMFSVSLVLIPIVMGVMIGGPLSGLWLGLVFGVTVLVTGDAAFFMGFDPFGTIVTVIAKGLLCGLCAGLVFNLLDKKNRYLAVFSAAVVCPIVNTGVFLLGTFIFFLDDLKVFAVAENMNVVAYIFLFLIGGNFFFELIFNIVLCPAVTRLLNISKLRLFKR